MSLHHWVSWRQNHPHETPWLRLVDPTLGVAGQTRLQGPVTEGDVVEEHREEPGAVPGPGLACAELSTQTHFWLSGPWKAELPAPLHPGPEPAEAPGSSSLPGIAAVLGKRPSPAPGAGLPASLVKGPGPGVALTWADYPQRTSVVVTLWVLLRPSGCGWGQCPGRPWTSTVLRGRRPAFSVWEELSLMSAHTRHQCKGPEVRGYKPG